MDREDTTCNTWVPYIRIRRVTPVDTIVINTSFVFQLVREYNTSREGSRCQLVQSSGQTRATRYRGLTSANISDGVQCRRVHGNPDGYCRRVTDPWRVVPSYSRRDTPVNWRESRGKPQRNVRETPRASR